MTLSRARPWPGVTLAFAAVVITAVAVAGGAARSSAGTADQAAQLAAGGQYGLAIALDTALAGHTGPLFVLDSADADTARLNAQRTMLAWAEAVDRAGHVDQAVVIAGWVTDPRLAADAGRERASLLLEAARHAAAKGDFATALARLDQITTISLTSASLVGQVATLEPQYQLGAATSLTNAGDGVDAVTLLDAATLHGASVATGAASLYPTALLAAGRQEIAAQSYHEAATTLQRLVKQYGATFEARQARQLLGAGQPVTGTLVSKSGSPLSGEVRLSSHFYSEPGGYTTSGPFYYGSAAADGSFRFDAIPVGGPYVFELYHNGGWTTFVDPNTGQPANPVSVTPLVPVDLAFITVP